MLEDFVLVADAARELGISTWGVWKAIERGQLAARKVGRQYFIARLELERFKALPRRPGPKPRRPTD
jgi:excisionase family DNA binding protein